MNIPACRSLLCVDWENRPVLYLYQLSVTFSWLSKSLIPFSVEKLRAQRKGAGERAQQLRALATLAMGLG